APLPTTLLRRPSATLSQSRREARSRFARGLPSFRGRGKTCLRPPSLSHSLFLSFFLSFFVPLEAGIRWDRGRSDEMLARTGRGGGGRRGRGGGTGRNGQGKETGEVGALGGPKAGRSRAVLWQFFGDAAAACLPPTPTTPSSARQPLSLRRSFHSIPLRSVKV